jgi:hypothetical protein
VAVNLVQRYSHSIEEVVPDLEYVLSPTYSLYGRVEENGSSILSKEIDRRLNLPS